MALRFIIGRAGTGKTELCLNEVREALRQAPNGQPLILLVPEQATFQMEYAIVNTPGLGGIVRAQVLSFQRLAYRVLQETGGASRIMIGEVGKRMVLRRLLEKHREALQAFGRSVDKPGFADTLARAIGELKLYQVGPLVLKDTARQVGGGLGILPAKLHDLSIIYEDFERFLSDRYTDPDDSLALLADRLTSSALVRDAEVWVDGFTGFTPQELSVLENLLRRGKRVTVALCMEPELMSIGATENDLFYPTFATYSDLLERAAKAKVTVENSVLLESQEPPRFMRSKTLAHLEQNFFTYPTCKLEDNSGLKMVAGVNKRAELEAVAREIISLCRDRDFRWKDIAVLLRDINPYREMIAGIFEEHGIPFFMDCKRDMLHHPLVELVRSAMELAFKDWAYEPLFRCLKTDLTSIDREGQDILENYVLAFGLKGYSRWSSGEWNYFKNLTLGEDKEPSESQRHELDQVNALRLQVVNIFGSYTEEVWRASSVLQVISALYKLLEDLRVPDLLHGWAVQAEGEGRLAEAREHLQVWGAVTGLLEEMVEAVGEESLSLSDCLAILEAGLEGLRLALIPPGLDQVTIGTIDRSRNANIKALFIIGVSEGVIPARQPDEGLFNDSEREELKEAGVVLAPGGRRKAFDEQYLIYTALTRARDYLWLSWPLSDEEGRAVAPSPVITRIKEIFPEIEECLCQVDSTSDVLSVVVHPGRSLGYLGSVLRELRAGREMAPGWWDLYNYFLSKAEGSFLLSRITQGLFYQNRETNLPPQVGRKLYGFPIRASVSRLEKYNACPFAHFASYGLRLRERHVYRLAAPDLGEFFHAALKLFVDRLEKERLDWAQVSEKVSSKLIGEIVEQLAPQLQNEILLSTARHRYLTGKLRRNVKRAVSVLSEHARRSSFRPVGVEIGFGPGAQLPPVIVDLPAGEKLELVGRIDRIDAASDGKVNYLRVIDYKSGEAKLALDTVYYGLRLQLLTYLLVVLVHSEKLIGAPAHPGGVLYFTVKEPMISAQGPLTLEKVQKEMLKKLKMQGLLLENPEVIRMMDSSLGAGWSELLPVAINKDEGFYANSKVAALEQFELLQCFLQRIFVQSGTGILEGVVAIAPYKYQNLTACTYCPFKSVCLFDPLSDENNQYRNLKRLGDGQVWEQISRVRGDG